MSPVSDLNFEPGIAGLPPKLASLWGFRSSERGTHTSRTIMLDELSQLLDAAPGEASRRDYAQAVMEGNCLGKRTAATRKHSLQRLTELYGLDARLLLFRVLKRLWGRHEASRPLLALLLALARDPLLRASARAVVATPFGHELGRQAMKDALSGIVEGRLNDATLDKVVRDASSSWTQSGHLRGRGRRRRWPTRWCRGSRSGAAGACCSRRPGRRCWMRRPVSSSRSPWMPGDSGWSISSSPGA